MLFRSADRDGRMQPQEADDAAQRLDRRPQVAERRRGNDVLGQEGLAGFLIIFAMVNISLGVLNLLPLLPLDGGRILVGLLPDVLSTPLRRLEPYGLMILIGLIFVLPLLGAQLGIDLNIVWRLVQRSTSIIIDAILRLTGNT